MHRVASQEQMDLYIVFTCFFVFFQADSCYRASRFDCRKPRTKETRVILKRAALYLYIRSVLRFILSSMLLRYSDSRCVDIILDLSTTYVTGCTEDQVSKLLIR